LLAECIRLGAWAELDAPGLAALVGALVYEGGRDDRDEIPSDLNKQVTAALHKTQQIFKDLSNIAREHHLEPPRNLALGLVQPIYRWTKGDSLSSVLRYSDLAPGDFVRWCKQVVDVLNQIAVIAPTTRMRNNARIAKDSILRGVVAYSALDTEEEEAAA